MILCPVIGCELEHKAKAMCDRLNGSDGVAPSKAYLEVHEQCARCNKLKHWERLEDGTARPMKIGESSALLRSDSTNA